jgi:radical SAM superfamily enzyme YgiQ (UPF0313 family)
VRVHLILPALTEARSPFWRPIKYSLFPPLGLATLAAHLDAHDEATLTDEHVEDVPLHGDHELVVIQVYITNARRSYDLADHFRARGAFVILGGLHVTSLPGEAAPHADAIFLGPGDDTFPEFLRDYKAQRAGKRYVSKVRTLIGVPPIRRDLIKRSHYLVPNSIVVTRGCPHHCDFCYKDAFFEGGKGFYTQPVDDALFEIDRLPGRHLYFLDDHLLGHTRFAQSLFAGMKGMQRLWQAASTVDAVLRGDLIERAVDAGLRSLFIGFESLSSTNLAQANKKQNLGRDYSVAIKRLRDLGVMINGSFVFGMDDDDPSVFERTVEWAVRQGITTATFHVLTPYPGTALYARMQAENRITRNDWSLYDTRHAVFTPRGMTAQQLEDGYWRSYRNFYTWRNIARSASTHDSVVHGLRHLAYGAGWKKFEPAWDLLIRARRLRNVLPLLETVLNRRQAAVHRAAPHSPRSAAAPVVWMDRLR